MPTIGSLSRLLALAASVAAAALAAGASCDAAEAPRAANEPGPTTVPPAAARPTRAARSTTVQRCIAAFVERGLAPEQSRELESLFDAGREGVSGLVEVVIDENATAAEREAALLLLVSFRRVDPALLSRVPAALGSIDLHVGALVAQHLPEIEPFPLDEVRQQLAPEQSHRAHMHAARCIGYRGAGAEIAVADLIRALRREAALPPDDGLEEQDLGGRIGHPEEHHVVTTVSVELCQREIIEALVLVGDGSAPVVGALIESARPSPAVRDAACEGLGRSVAGCGALCDLAAGDAEFAVRRCALDALAGSAHASRDFAARLIGCVEREEPDGALECREAALRALGRLPHPGAPTVEAFRRALASSSSAIRTAAADAASRSDELAHAVAEEIERALDDPELSVVTAALGALRSSGAGILSRVEGHLASPNADSQSAAAAAFARVAGREELLRELVAARSTPHRAVHVHALLRFPEHAADSLRRVAHLHDSSDPEVVKGLLELARRSGAEALPQFAALGGRLLSASERIEAIDHVASVGGDRAAALLRTFLRQKRPAVRGAAVRALLGAPQSASSEQDRFVEATIRDAGGAAEGAVAVAVVSARPDVAAAMLERGQILPSALISIESPLPDAVAIDVARFVGAHAVQFRALRGFILCLWGMDRRAPAVEAAQDAALRELARSGDE